MVYIYRRSTYVYVDFITVYNGYSDNGYTGCPIITGLSIVNICRTN